jgi:ABC-type multidrug transport system fused ATPase/permease subunit
LSGFFDWQRHGTEPPYYDTRLKYARYRPQTFPGIDSTRLAYAEELFQLCGTESPVNDSVKPLHIKKGEVGFKNFNLGFTQGKLIVLFGETGTDKSTIL